MTALLLSYSKHVDDLTIQSTSLKEGCKQSAKYVVFLRKPIKAKKNKTKQELHFCCY